MQCSDTRILHPRPVSKISPLYVPAVETCYSLIAKTLTPLPLEQYTETIGKCICINIYVKIHGGGFNPFETVSQIENLPQIGAEHKKYSLKPPSKHMENIKVTKIQNHQKNSPPQLGCVLARIYGETLANIPVPPTGYGKHQSWTSTKTRSTKAVSQVDPDSSLLGSAGGRLKNTWDLLHQMADFLWTNSRLMVTRPMNPMGIGNCYPLVN